MKSWLILFLLICSGTVVTGQHFHDFAVVDHKASNIPAAHTHSTASIAGYIQSNFKTDPEKLRAIYSWVITNVKYDRDSMLHINWSMENDDKIAATLRRRKGVCENYAALFTDIALKSGFPSYVVNGYTKLSGSRNSAGHSWSAVRLQNHWYLCDPTWDEGRSTGTNYFLVPPGRFIESHMPFDPLWQLVEYPLTDIEFRRGIFTAKKNAPYFNFADSAAAFLQLDSLQQLESSARRIQQAGIENEKMNKNWLAYNKMKIAIIYGENDMNLYNAAVEDLNQANRIFNEFVNYRNNRFIPAKPDARVKSLLDPIAGILASALEKLGRMGQAVENFQYDTGDLKINLTNLTRRVKEQQTFLDRYLASNEADREKLFYK